MCAVSCEVYNDEQYMEEPGYILVQRTYSDYIHDIFRVAELSDFFRQYQDIRSDREAAVSLAENYFHESFSWDRCLYYEQADIDGWGKIELAKDGTFRVRSCIGYNRIFNVSHLGGRRFAISFGSQGNKYDDLLSLSATVNCDEDWVTLETCSFSCSFPDSGFCSVSSVESAPVRKGIVSGQGLTYAPQSGRLAYEYYDDYGSEDSFETSFSEDFQTVERDGTVVKCLPVRYNSYNSVDYVIE